MDLPSPWPMSSQEESLDIVRFDSDSDMAWRNRLFGGTRNEPAEATKVKHRAMEAAPVKKRFGR